MPEVPAQILSAVTTDHKHEPGNRTYDHDTMTSHQETMTSTAENMSSLTGYSDVKDHQRNIPYATKMTDSMMSHAESVTSHRGYCDVKEHEVKMPHPIRTKDIMCPLAPISDLCNRTPESRRDMTSSEHMTSYTELGDVRDPELRKSYYSMFSSNQDPFFYNKNNNDTCNGSLPFLTSTPYHGASYSHGISSGRDLETSTGDSYELISYSEESTTNQSMDEYIDVLSE